MKLFTLLTLFLCVGASASVVADEAVALVKPEKVKLNWFTDIEQAKSEAKNTSKPIFLYFSGSDWCPHCMKMDRAVLETAEFQKAVGDSIVFMHADFPRHKQLSKELRQQNDHLKKKFDIHGFPTILVVDADLHLIGKPTRKLDPTAFADEVKKLIK